METYEDRKQVAVDFIEQLQLEYFTHKCRSIIYEKDCYKKMHADIADKKKEKIIQVAWKWKITSIFDSEMEYFNFLYSRFLNEKGLPNFQYKDGRVNLQVFDRKMFFAGNVLYMDIPCRVEVNYPETETCVLLLSGGLKKRVSYNEIKKEIFI